MILGMTKHVIDQLGGTSAVARMCRVAAASVCGWRKKGIPAAHCAQIERVTGRLAETINPSLPWVRVPRAGWPSGAPALLVLP